MTLMWMIMMMSGITLLIIHHDKNVEGTKPQQHQQHPPAFEQSSLGHHHPHGSMDSNLHLNSGQRPTGK